MERAAMASVIKLASFLKAFPSAPLLGIISTTSTTFGSDNFDSAQSLTPVAWRDQWLLLINTEQNLKYHPSNDNLQSYLQYYCVNEIDSQGNDETSVLSVIVEMGHA